MPSAPFTCFLNPRIQSRVHCSSRDRPLRHGLPSLCAAVEGEASQPNCLCGLSTAESQSSFRGVQDLVPGITSRVAAQIEQRPRTLQGRGLYLLFYLPPNPQSVLIIHGKIKIHRIFRMNLRNVSLIHQKCKACSTKYQ